ncbi:MAG: ZIP family metal transporter [Endomicrobiales bacterium]|nr:ZIP family metal transporter [Endomicrobiales bacterium]
MVFRDVLCYSLIAGTATILGSYLVLKNEAWAKKNSVFLIGFAAGVMLALAFLHLIPESLEICADAVLYVFVGFLVFYLLQQVVMFHPCHDEACRVHRLGLLSSLGLIFHSLLDGVAIAVGFETAWSLGVLTTLAVLFHEIPEGITITGILVHSGAKKKSVILYSLAVAAATPLGAVGSYFFIKNFSPWILGMLLAVTAGSFVYLAAADLLPETHREHNRANILFFSAGIALIFLVGRFMH